MITEDYVSFETAKLLKEKGFNEPTNEFFDGQKGLSKEKEIYGGVPDFGECCWNEDPFVHMGFPKFKTFAKPSIAQVIKWLREVHKIFIEISYDSHEFENAPYFSLITNMNTNDYFKGHNLPGEKPTYEEACEAAIKYCLENLI